MHFKEYCIRKCARENILVVQRKFIALLEVMFLFFFVIWRTRKMSDGMSSDAVNIQQFSNPTLQLTRPGQQQEPMQKVGVTFCLVNILTRKTMAKNGHLCIFPPSHYEAAGLCLRACRCLAKPSSTAVHYVSEQSRVLDSFRKTNCRQ